LAVNRHVSASTQTQALNALVFLYDSVLQMPLGTLAGLKRVQRRERVPVVLTREEVKAILEIALPLARGRESLVRIYRALFIFRPPAKNKVAIS